MNQTHLPIDLPQQLKSLGLAPSELVLYLSASCNLRCRHCYVGDDLLASNERFDADDVLRFVADLGPLDRVNVIGGEPLLHPQIDRIVNNLASMPIGELRLTTNLTSTFHFHPTEHLNDNLLIGVSLDGPTAPVHDSVRGKGTFARTMRNIVWLRELGFDIEITHTVMGPTAKSVVDMVELCRSHKIWKLNLHKMSLQGNAVDHPELAVAPDAWVRLVQLLRLHGGLGPGLPDDVRVRFPPLFVTEEEYTHLRSTGYSHQAEQSFYGDRAGQRIVLYPDMKLYMSSEAFGTEAHIGEIRNGAFIANTTTANERALAARSDFDLSLVNALQCGTETHPVVLSVSYKEQLWF